jgi:anti-sigma factor RsiW
MMHREIQNHVEDLLRGAEAAASKQHLAECEECRAKVQAMREHAALLRALRPPEDGVAEPRAGFYARVMERIEAEGPISIWNLFIESAFGRRIAVASMALALLLGIYLITSERTAEEPVIAIQQDQFMSPESPLPASLVVADEDAPGRLVAPQVLSADGQLVDGKPVDGQPLNGQPDDDAILVNLVTYQDQ